MPARVAATSRSNRSITSATAAWWAATIRSWVTASATPQSTETDFGTLKVRSNPATASAHPGRGLLGLDPGGLGRAVLLGHLRVERGDALLDPVSEPLVRRIRPAELLSRDGVAAHADEQGELLLGHLHARPDLAGTEGSDAGSEPAAGRRTDLGVVAGQRRRQRALAVTGRDAAQQVLVAAARGHPAHRDRHGRFRPTALRCASFSTTPSICTPCEGEKGWGETRRRERRARKGKRRRGRGEARRAAEVREDGGLEDREHLSSGLGKDGRVRNQKSGLR